MSLPADYPLKLYHGDSYEWQFKLWLDEGKTQPLDLTDVVAKSEIRNKSGGDYILELDCSVTLPNIISTSLSATKSLTMPLGPLVWDLQLTYPTGAVNTIVGGAVSVLADVTDSGTPAPLLMSVEPQSAPMVRTMKTVAK